MADTNLQGDQEHGIERRKRHDTQVCFTGYIAGIPLEAWYTPSSCNCSTFTGRTARNYLRSADRTTPPL